MTIGYIGLGAETNETKVKTLKLVGGRRGDLGRCTRRRATRNGNANW